MSYSVDLESEDLVGKDERSAHSAVELINSHCWAKYHLKVETVRRPLGDGAHAWCIELLEFDGCGWKSEPAAALWLTLAPHLADGSSLEFRGESAERWRIRWEGGHVYEEFVEAVTWKVAHEILPPQQGVSP